MLQGLRGSPESRAQTLREGSTQSSVSGQELVGPGVRTERPVAGVRGCAETLFCNNLETLAAFLGCRASRCCV